MSDHGVILARLGPIKMVLVLISSCIQNVDVSPEWNPAPVAVSLTSGELDLSVGRNQDIPDKVPSGPMAAMPDLRVTSFFGTAAAISLTSGGKLDIPAGLHSDRTLVIPVNRDSSMTDLGKVTIASPSATVELDPAICRLYEYVSVVTAFGRRRGERVIRIVVAAAIGVDRYPTMTNVGEGIKDIADP